MRFPGTAFHLLNSTLIKKHIFFHSDKADTKEGARNENKQMNKNPWASSTFSLLLHLPVVSSGLMFSMLNYFFCFVLVTVWVERRTADEENRISMVIYYHHKFSKALYPPMI